MSEKRQDASKIPQPDDALRMAFAAYRDAACRGLDGPESIRAAFDSVGIRLERYKDTLGKRMRYRYASRFFTVWEVSCPESASSTKNSQPSQSTEDSSSPPDAGPA